MRSTLLVVAALLGLLNQACDEAFAARFRPRVERGGGSGKGGAVGSVVAAFSNTKSLATDGVDGYVSVTHHSSLNCTTNWSMSFWIKQDTSWDTNDIVWRKGDSGNTQNVSYMMVRNATNIAVYIAATVTDTGTNFGQFAHSLLPVNQWNHVAITYDGGGSTNADKLNAYVNGSDVNITSFGGTIPATLTSGTGNLAFMARDGGSGDWGPGNQDEITWYCITLTGGQVTELYNSGSPGDTSTYSTAANRVSHWSFEDDYTDSVASNNGTANGTGLSFDSDVP